ncbi:UNVERIFIED_CONTAM: hypothetical protein HDU68_012926, partial [Siphonaria sp. JEL0065]
LLPTFFYIAFDAIASNPLSTQLPTISKQLPLLTRQITSIRWSAPDSIDVSLSEFLVTLNRLEYQMGVAQSLLYKIPMQLLLVDRVISSIPVGRDESDGVWIEEGGGSGGESLGDGTMVGNVKGELERKARDFI